MASNLNHLLTSTTNERLKRHGLSLVLDNDTTGMYRNVRCNEKLLSVDIHSNQDTISEAGTILLLSADKVDSQINEKIDGIIKQIDNAGKNTIKITFDAMKRNIPDNIDPLTHIGNKLDILFGFKPVFGSLNEDVRLSRYEVSLLLDSLPYFKSIDKKCVRNLYPSIHQYIGDLLESGYFEVPEKEQVTDLLNTNSSYDRWSPLMLNALMMVLLEPVEGIQFIHATISTRTRQMPAIR